MQSRPRGLVQHVERVASEALDLARRWDLDLERVELAAWGHDLFRSFPEAEQLQMARDAGLPIVSADLASPIVLHGPVAAEVLRERFGVVDADVLAAIRDHTLGFARMPLIARVILLADKIEARKRRRDPIMADVRRLARRNLDAAVLCWADWKWVEERTHGWSGHPGHWDARATWVHEHHLEAALPLRIPDVDFEE
jgi:predicted HD superfamily hydrolase involved in NAD metabolism